MVRPVSFWSVFVRPAAGLLLLAAACTTSPEAADDSSPPSPNVDGEALALTTCWSAPPHLDGGVSLTDATADFGLVVPLTGMHPHAAAAADVDGDGWTDIFVGTFADRPAEDYALRGATGPAPDRLLLGGPDGFIVDPTFPEEYARTSGASFADLDGDGDPDLIAARNPRQNSEISHVPTTVFENAGDGWLPRAQLSPSTRARAVVALDIDDDDVLDLVVLGDGRGEGGTTVYRGDGNFGFSPAPEWGVPADLTGLGMTAIDLDGDGWRDLAVNGDDRVMRGGAEGFSVDRVPELIWDRHGDEDDPAGVAVGDLDHDGRPDLVLGQHYNSTLDDGQRVPVRILLNRSTPGEVAMIDVTSGTASPALWTKSPHVSVHDVDNDGWDDIVTSAATSSGAPLVLRNRGLGDAGLPRFEVLGDEGDGEYFVTGVDADLDRDGRIDSLLLAWEPARPSRLFRNISGGGHWLQVDLSHIDDPVGTEIRVLEPTTRERVGSEWIEGTTGYAAGGDNVGHVGLGETTTEEVIVEVSAAGRDSVVGRVRIDRRSGLAGCAG